MAKFRTDRITGRLFRRTQSNMIDPIGKKKVAGYDHRLRTLYLLDQEHIGCNLLSVAVQLSTVSFNPVK